MARARVKITLGDPAEISSKHDFGHNNDNNANSILPMYLRRFAHVLDKKKKTRSNRIIFSERRSKYVRVILFENLKVDRLRHAMHDGFSNIRGSRTKNCSNARGK